MSRLQVEIVTERKWKDILAHPPCEHVTEDSLGYADHQRGKAYVRQTLWPELNKYLLQHEFDHLLEEEGTDECVHGMRHKKFFKQIAAPILAPGIAPFIQKGFTGAAVKDLARTGTATLGGFLTGGPVGAVGAASVQGLRNAAVPPGTKNPLTGRSLLGAGGTGAGVGGVASFAGPSLGLPASASQGPLTAGLQSFFKGGSQATSTNPLTASASSPGVSGGTVTSRLGQSGLGGGGLSVPSNIYTPSGSPFNPSSGFTTPPTPPPSGPTNRLAGLFSGAGNALSKFGVPAGILGPTLLGTGVAGAGQAIGNARQPEIPELSQLPSVQAFSQQGQQQFGDLRTRLQNLSTQALPPDLASPIRRQYNILRQEATGQFKNFRPGADLATDTGYQRLLQDIAQRESESIAQAQLSFQENQRQNIATELGVDSQQLGVLQSIAQLDIDTIMARTGLRSQEAAQLKELFGNVGSTIAGAGVLGHFMRQANQSTQQQQTVTP